MSRLEFSRTVRRQTHDRANGHCERCGAVLKQGEGECDHILPAELDGKPILANAQWLCRVCHREKTGNDIRRIRKADRIRDKASGAMKRPRHIMPGSRRSPWKRKMNGQVEKRT